MTQSSAYAQQASPTIDSSALLALGVERRVLRVCLLEPIAGRHRLAGWISVQRDPMGELTQQLAIACRRLGSRLGRALWDDEAAAPLMQSADPVRLPPVSQVVAAATPRDLLRVWIAGLSPTDSMAAARAAAQAAPARIVGETALDATLDIADLTSRFSADRPDVLVITGGYDNPDPNIERPVYRLARMMSELLRRLPPGERPLVLYAGDRWMASACVDRLQSAGDGLTVTAIENLRPSPNRVVTAPLAARLAAHQTSLAQRMAGFVRLGRWVTAPARIMSLEDNFTQAVHAWCAVRNLPVLHGLYFAANWRLHVLVEAGMETALLRYVEEPAHALQSDRLQIDGWPPVDLVSGMPSGRGLPAPRWHDRSGMLPVVAAVGRLAPRAMLHAMTHDLLAEVRV
ncbi:MAG: glutamate mutase L [Caldilineaceae bacterium]|nr:glutamate mutase L [Caldilineaceae bacterium]